jgi:hypothetical protein
VLRRWVLATILGGLAAVPAAHAAAKLEPVEVFTLSWVGDIAFSSDRGLPAGDVRGAIGPLKPFLKADIVTGNLEGTLATGGASKCGRRRRAVAHQGGNCFAFRAPPRYARGLRRVGFDLMNVANNHHNDFGETGQAQTVAALRGARVAYTGRPGQITVLRVRHAKVAFVGFAPYAWAAPLLDIPAAASLVRAAKRRADLVVVMMHQGAEGAGALHVPFGSETAFGENRGNPRAFTHAMIDAGAGLVLGSGPHVIRGVERYHHRMIAYSLGNFAGPHTLAAGGVTAVSAILRVEISSDGDILGGRWVPVRLVSPGIPRYDATRESIALVKRLSMSDFRHRFAIFSDGRIGKDPAARR